MNKLNQLLSDGDGQPSLMRVMALLIVCPIMFVWAWLSIKAGTMIPIPWTQITALGGALGFKALQSFAENKGPVEQFVTSVSPPSKPASGTITSLLLCGLLALGSVGCMTSKVITTSPTGVVTTNTIVNTNNLQLDCMLIEGAAAFGVDEAIQQDPTLREPLQATQTALDGVLYGINPATSNQCLELLGAGNNPVIAAQVTPLIGMASSLEQTLLAKYGGGVGAQITIAITRAIDAGFVKGLGGVK